ncbi:fibronectin type III domain-containing protein [Polaribacter sp. L3A8]|uniref:fibronectin type III domain-containing protein n=1 Tax=Polaribacter sp. L3A8 TaxID=2686361 RepID=UPI00131C7AFD|nr:hypothetical protein [Polaribacter sp. L3A8]
MKVRKLINRVFVVSSILLLSFISNAQQNKLKDSLPTVRILSRVQENKVLLRWGVDQPIAWQKTNKSGFVLEKYLFSKDGNRLPIPKILWQKTIKAAPLETWQNIVASNNYAAIIAQAIYGESFEVGGVSGGQLSKIVNQSQEIQQRFSFALFAADMNFDAAKKAGWGFEDTELLENEEYVYKIKIALPKEVLNVKSSAIIAGLKDYEPLPSPTDLQGIFGDKNVIVTWEYALYKTIYTSYNLERSENGIDFKQLNKEPLLNINDKPHAPAKRMYYVDSLAQNDKKYFYRVNGISSFGETGAYSDTISGVGKPVLPFTPKISDFKFTNSENEAIIYWEFPKEGEKVTAKFQLNHAEKDSGPYKVVVDNIPADQRSLTYSNLDPSNYFTITAVGTTAKQQKTSFSKLVQAIDTTPPVKPVGLEGKIDSLGIVRFNWKANTEKDILGYRVFRGFTEKEEPSQITISPIKNNKFIDTVIVANLNAKVYYKVVAVDKRFNHSEMSEVLILEKPDVIPPTAPVFSNYKIDQGAVQLTWINSSEENATHILLRKNMTDAFAWKEIYRVTDGTIQSFKDTKVEADKTYRYAIKAIDKSGLESLPSSPLTIKVVNLTPASSIKEINFIVNRENNYIELFWRADTKKIAEYTIYKQVEGEKPTTWRVLPVTVKRTVDKDVYPNQVYIYHFRATENDGSYSKVKKVEVKF